MKWTLGLMLLLAPVAAMAQSAPFQANGQCPAGSTLLTYEAAVAQRNAICPALGAWSISRLAGGGSMDGSGYACQVRQRDDRQLGHSVCVNAPVAGGDHRHMLAEYEREHLEDRAKPFALDPNLVRMVQMDRVSGNFLFRGDMPVKDGVFQYDALVAAMRSAGQASGQPLPPRFRVVDISLLDDLIPSEKKGLGVEKAYWTANPGKGQFIHNAIYGSLTSPNSYSESKRRDLAKHPSLGNIGELVDRVHALLSTRPADGVPLLIYVHCEAGKDRTGEVMAAYDMKYKRTPYKAAFANAETVAGRPISSYSKHGLQWYGYYLFFYENSTTVGPIN